jgi:UDP-glucose 4-epimerase
VVILDDMSSGKRENIEPLLKAGAAEFIVGSVTDLPLLQRVFQDASCVFHFAAISSVPSGVSDPLSSDEVNVTGTLKTLLAAQHCGVGKVVFASSCAVYGDDPALPKNEAMLPAPRSPYAVTKLAGENYCQVFSQLYGLPTVCLRFFNVYGPRQDAASQYAAVIPIFLERIKEYAPPQILGDGEQTRDFVFVKDVVAASLLAAEAAASGIYNIGSGQATSINELARLITKLGGGSLTPVYEPPRPGDIKHSYADTSRAGAIGYRPKFNLEDGLRLTMAYFNEC